MAAEEVPERGVRIIVCRDRRKLTTRQVADAELVIEVSSFRQGVATVVKCRDPYPSVEVIGR